MNKPDKKDSIVDIRLREALDECEHLRTMLREKEEELKMMDDIINEFTENIKLMVIANPQYYREKEVDVWEMFLKFCLTEEERHAKGWLLDEDIHH